MERLTWLAANRNAIEGRLRWLKEKPDGVISVEPSGPHFVIVTKTGPQILLLLTEQVHPRATITQSQLDLADPLHLVAPYTQAAMLSLAWVDDPRRIFVAGIGGGRVPQVFHHHLPAVTLDCVDIDPVVVKVAHKYFGLRTDQRLRVVIDDGREWLAACDAQTEFDIIFVDVFLGTGYSSYRMATQEFLVLCRDHLSANGVLVVNLFDTDPFFGSKLKTMAAVFQTVYVCPVPGENSVIFGSRAAPVPMAELAERAAAVQHLQRFSFPFLEHASVLRLTTDVERYVNDLKTSLILIDDAPPNGYFDQLPSFDSLSLSDGPRLMCPCGSGRAIADCHARRPPAGGALSERATFA